MYQQSDRSEEFSGRPGEGEGRDSRRQNVQGGLNQAIRPATGHDVKRVLGNPSLIRELWKQLGDPPTSVDDQVVVSMPVDGRGARIKVQAKAGTPHVFPDSVILPIGNDLVRIPIEAHYDLDDIRPM